MPGIPIGAAISKNHLDAHRLPRADLERRHDILITIAGICPVTAFIRGGRSPCPLLARAASIPTSLRPATA